MSKQSRTEVSRPGKNKKKVESNKSKNKKNQQREQLGEKAFEIEREREVEKQLAKGNLKANEKKLRPHPLLVNTTTPCIDCGCALNSRQLQNQFDKIIDRAFKSGVVAILSFSTSETIEENLSIAKEESKLKVFCSLYVHAQQKIRTIQEVSQFINDNVLKPEIISIGPVSYDGDEKKISKAVQLERIDIQWKAAVQHRLPILFRITDIKLLLQTWDKILQDTETEKSAKIAKINQDFNPFSATFQGDLDSLKIYYQQQLLLPEEDRKESLLTLRDKDHNYSPLLYTASCKGHDDIVKWLLEIGCDINITNSHGATALHSCCTFNQIECCKLLLESGANIEIENKFNETPLAISTKKKYDKIVNLFNQPINMKPIIPNNEGEVKSTIPNAAIIINSKLTIEEIKELHDKNFYFGISGLISETNYLAHYEALNIKELIDINKIIVFSNGPYNTPQNIKDEVIRSAPNEPSNLDYIFELLAKFYDIEESLFKKNVFENTLKFFSLDIIDETLSKK